MSIPTFRARSYGLAAVVALGLVLAACSSSGATPSPSSAAASAPAASASQAAAESEEASASAEASGEAYKIAVATNAKVGMYLTGEDGKTLYVFKNDTQANQSTCTGDCATNWPPFTLEEDEKAEAGAGVTGTIATFDRPDGTKQVSYNGKPLYYFGGDKAAGDVNGQGIKNIWFAATP
jgi:predicted lipoprotein with Yx(FWY)xxD motif